MRFGQWLGNGRSGGSYTGGPFRLVIHTTETSGLPGYNDGLSAPHITYDPEFRNFYQHTDFETAARALRNLSGGVQTNRRSALQIEIICYSSKTIADQTVSRMWVGDLTDDHYADLGGFLDFCHQEYGVTMVWPNRQAFTSSQANAAGFRMTAVEWNGFGGVCGHQHVPENTHWDPGALDWGRLIEEDELTPAQEAKLDAALALLQNVPDVTANKVLGREWTEAGIGPDDKVTVLQSVVKGYKNTVGIRAAVADLKNMETVELKAIGDAVADELAERLA